MSKPGKSVWIGRTLSGLVTLMLVFSGSMKFNVTPELEKGFAHLGLPMTMAVPLGILELSCVVVYLIPATSVLGSVLLTGYMGGAMLTHWRVGDPFFVQFLIGVFAWLGLYLRENRLKSLLPLRRPGA